MATDTIQQKKQATAHLKHLRIAPRKVRLVANLIKGLPVSQALAQLHILTKRSSHPIAKLIQSAQANAKEAGLNEKKLVVESITVDKGPILKRWMPRAQGRATPIHKMTSHISVILIEREKEYESVFVTDIKKEKKSEKKDTQTKKSKDVKKPEKETTIKKERPVDTQGHKQGMFRRKSV